MTANGDEIFFWLRHAAVYDIQKLVLYVRWAPHTANSIFDCSAV